MISHIYIQMMISLIISKQLLIYNFKINQKDSENTPKVILILYQILSCSYYYIYLQFQIADAV